MTFLGIQSVEDAELAVKAGVQGIVVSNHGGRQYDGAVGSLSMLPSIVDAVGDKLIVLFDSGIRTGADIMKALALGAKAVLVGRPIFYGLAVSGEAGAEHVLRCILAVGQKLNSVAIQFNANSWQLGFRYEYGPCWPKEPKTTFEKDPYVRGVGTVNY